MASVLSTGTGRPFLRTAGHGSVTTRGDGRRTTTAGGGSRAGAGSGLPDEPGARHGCRGRPRRVTSAGVPWATAGALASRSACRSAVHGMDGSSCPTRTSATAIGTPFTITPFRRRRFRTARRSRSRRAPRSRRPSPLRGHVAVPRASAGGSQVRASARSAPGRQPVTAPGATRTVTPNQPELGVRAVQRSQSPAAPAGARYVPDARTRVGPSRQASPGVAPSNQGTASPRRYPPVTMTQPRAEQAPGVNAPSAGYRSGPIQRAQPSTTCAAQPGRRPVARPAASARRRTAGVGIPARDASDRSAAQGIHLARPPPPARRRARRRPCRARRLHPPPRLKPRPARPASGGAPAGARAAPQRVGSRRVGSRAVGSAINVPRVASLGTLGVVERSSSDSSDMTSRLDLLDY